MVQVRVDQGWTKGGPLDHLLPIEVSMNSKNVTKEDEQLIAALAARDVAGERQLDALAQAWGMDVRSHSAFLAPAPGSPIRAWEAAAHAVRDAVRDQERAQALASKDEARVWESAMVDLWEGLGGDQELAHANAIWDAIAGPISAAADVWFAQWLTTGKFPTPQCPSLGACPERDRVDELELVRPKAQG